MLIDPASAFKRIEAVSGKVRLSGTSATAVSRQRSAVVPQAPRRRMPPLLSQKALDDYLTKLKGNLEGESARQAIGSLCTAIQQPIRGILLGLYRPPQRQPQETLVQSAFSFLPRYIAAAIKAGCNTADTFTGYLIRCMRHERANVIRLCEGQPALVGGEEEVLTWIRRANETLVHQKQGAPYTQEEVLRAMLPSYLQRLDRFRRSKSRRLGRTYHPILPAQITAAQEEGYLRRLKVLVTRLQLKHKGMFQLTPGEEGQDPFANVAEGKHRLSETLKASRPLNHYISWAEVSQHPRFKLDILPRLSPAQILCLQAEIHSPEKGKSGFEALQTQLEAHVGKPLSLPVVRARHSYAQHRIAAIFKELEKEPTKTKTRAGRKSYYRRHYETQALLLKAKSRQEQVAILARLNLAGCISILKRHQLFDTLGARCENPVNATHPIDSNAVLRQAYDEVHRLLMLPATQYPPINPITALWLLSLSDPQCLDGKLRNALMKQGLTEPNKGLTNLNKHQRLAEITPQSLETDLAEAYSS